MIKTIIFQFALFAFAIQQIFSLSDITPDPPSDRGKGITEMALPGSITHCQTDTGQQCFKVEPNVQDISIENPNNLTISCDSENNLCVFAFDAIESNSTVFITVNCLNYDGFKEGSNITAIFGNQGFNDTLGKPVYGSFFVNGPYAFAKYESGEPEDNYADQCNGTITSSIPAETIYFKCVGVDPFTGKPE